MVHGRCLGSPPPATILSSISPMCQTNKLRRSLMRK
jgi:hypothetical protein